MPDSGRCLQIVAELRQASGSTPCIPDPKNRDNRLASHVLLNDMFLELANMPKFSFVPEWSLFSRRS